MLSVLRPVARGVRLAGMTTPGCPRNRRPDYTGSGHAARHNRTIAYYNAVPVGTCRRFIIA